MEFLLQGLNIGQSECDVSRNQNLKDRPPPEVTAHKQLLSATKAASSKGRVRTKVSKSSVAAHSNALLDCRVHALTSPVVAREDVVERHLALLVVDLLFVALRQASIEDYL